MFSVQRLFSPALLAAALAGPALAQTAPADSARTYRHQLGLTANPQLDHFFTANRSLPIGLLYKQQTKPGQALRLRLVGFYSHRDSTNANPYFTPNTNSVGPNTTTWETNAFIGYEWRHSINRRFKWGYGAEFGGGYYHQQMEISLQEILIAPTNQALYVVTTNGSPFIHRWNLQGRGFANINYALSNRLTLFAETAIRLIYENEKRGGAVSQTFSDGQPIRLTRYNDIGRKSFRLELRPIQFLGIAASF
ncbi:MAG: hypothetical protein WKG07_33175 [Hymenobacter sp.]